MKNENCFSRAVLLTVSVLGSSLVVVDVSPEVSMLAVESEVTFIKLFWHSYQLVCYLEAINGSGCKFRNKRCVQCVNNFDCGPLRRCNRNNRCVLWSVKNIYLSMTIYIHNNIPYYLNKICYGLCYNWKLLAIATSNRNKQHYTRRELRWI